MRNLTTLCLSVVLCTLASLVAADGASDPALGPSGAQALRRLDQHDDEPRRLRQRRRRRRKRKPVIKSDDDLDDNDPDDNDDGDGDGGDGGGGGVKASATPPGDGVHAEGPPKSQPRPSTATATAPDATPATPMTTAVRDVVDPANANARLSSSASAAYTWVKSLVKDVPIVAGTQSEDTISLMAESLRQETSSKEGEGGGEAAIETISAATKSQKRIRAARKQARAQKRKQKRKAKRQRAAKRREKRKRSKMEDGDDAGPEGETEDDDDARPDLSANVRVESPKSSLHQSAGNGGADDGDDDSSESDE